MNYLVVMKSHAAKNGDRIQHIINHPPAAWQAKCGEKDGLFKIVAMQYEAMLEAKESGTHQELVESICHLAAASKMALDRMTC